MEKAETLVQLLGHLLPQDYGHGAPACSPADAELFFAADDDRFSSAEVAAAVAAPKVEAAKAICAACPIEASCLAWALRTRARGVLGGTTGEERHRMLRSVRRRARYAEAKTATVANEAMVVSS